MEQIFILNKTLVEVLANVKENQTLISDMFNLTNSLKEEITSKYNKIQKVIIFIILICGLKYLRVTFFEMCSRHVKEYWKQMLFLTKKPSTRL
jgi:hypothetical protein